MRKIALILAATAVLATGSALSARDRLSPQERLDKMLAGRVAGKPQSCLNFHSTRDMTVLDKTAIVYRDGSTLWVNRPDNAADLDDDDILVIKNSIGELCSVDIVTLIDRSGGFYRGFVNLGEFVPYRRVPGAS